MWISGGDGNGGQQHGSVTMLPADMASPLSLVTIPHELVLGVPGAYLSFSEPPLLPRLLRP